ncbi:MAG: hypothetical protein V1494_01330 [Candidatus Diapherotrites archaeon]
MPLKKWLDFFRGKKNPKIPPSEQGAHSTERFNWEPFFKEDPEFRISEHHNPNGRARGSHEKHYRQLPQRIIDRTVKERVLKEIGEEDFPIKLNPAQKERLVAGLQKTVQTAGYLDRLNPKIIQIIAKSVAKTHKEAQTRPDQFCEELLFFVENGRFKPKEE